MPDAVVTQILARAARRRARSPAEQGGYAVRAVRTGRRRGAHRHRAGGPDPRASTAAPLQGAERPAPRRARSPRAPARPGRGPEGRGPVPCDRPAGLSARRNRNPEPRCGIDVPVVWWASGAGDPGAAPRERRACCLPQTVEGRWRCAELRGLGGRLVLIAPPPASCWSDPEPSTSESSGATAPPSPSICSARGEQTPRPRSQPQPFWSEQAPTPRGRRRPQGAPESFADLAERMSPGSREHPDLEDGRRRARQLGRAPLEEFSLRRPPDERFEQHAARCRASAPAS